MEGVVVAELIVVAAGVEVTESSDWWRKARERK
jgi:tetrahydrodipicolinate N-succinyltransferase